MINVLKIICWKGQWDETGPIDMFMKGIKKFEWCRKKRHRNKQSYGTTTREKRKEKITVRELWAPDVYFEITRENGKKSMARL